MTTIHAPDAIRINHAHGATERCDSIEGALELIRTVYGEHVVAEGLENLAVPGGGRALVWASKAEAADDDGVRACASLVALWGDA